MWSHEAEELLGYSALEAIGQSVEIIIPHHLRERHRAGFARYIQTGISTLPEITTTIAVHKTGTHMNLPISVKAITEKTRKSRRWRQRSIRRPISPKVVFLHRPCNPDSVQKEIP